MCYSDGVGDGYFDGDGEFSFFLYIFFVPVLLSALLEIFSAFPYARFVRSLFFFFFSLLFYFRK